MEDDKFKFTIEKEDWYDFLIDLAGKTKIEKPKHHAAEIWAAYEAEVASKRITDSEKDFLNFIKGRF